MDDEPGPVFTGSGQHAARLTVVASVLLWLLVAAGALGGLAAWLVRPADAASGPPLSVRSSVGPTGWAQAFVSAYLRAGTGQEDQLRVYFPGIETLDKVTATSSSSSRVATYPVGATETSPGYWAVTVAVDSPGSDQPAGDRPVRDPGGTDLTDGSTGTDDRSGRNGDTAPLACYQVSLLARGDANAGGVSATGSPAGYAATRLPDRVACPPTLATAPSLALSSTDIDPNDPVNDVVRRFLAALLAGDGEVSRYSSPGAVIRPIIPAPYAGVELVSLVRDTSPSSGDSSGATAAPGTGQRLRVLATIRVSGSDGIQMLSYPLRLTSRAGRWEVSSLDGAPPLGDAHQPPVAPAPTPQDSAQPLTSSPTPEQPESEPLSPGPGTDTTSTPLAAATSDPSAPTSN